MVAPVELSVSLAQLQSYSSWHTRLDLSLVHLIAYQTANGISQQVPGTGLEFLEVRPYQPGDDLRHLDWSATARYGKPFTRAFQAEPQEHVAILVDLASQMQLGRAGSKAVLAAKLAAVLGWSAIKQQRALSWWLEVDQQHSYEHYQLQPPITSATKFTQVLAHLAKATQALGQVQPRPEGQLNQAIYRFVQAVPTQTVVFIVSDFVDFTAWQDLAQAARLKPLVLIQLTDPLDKHLPSGSGPLKLGARLIPLTPAVQQAWQQAFAQRQAALRQAVAGSKSGYLALSTQTAASWLHSLAPQLAKAWTGL